VRDCGATGNRYQGGAVNSAKKCISGPAHGFALSRRCFRKTGGKGCELGEIEASQLFLLIKMIWLGRQANLVSGSAVTAMC
jgi:hypothetical protein